MKARRLDGPPSTPNSPLADECGCPPDDVSGAAQQPVTEVSERELEAASGYRAVPEGASETKRTASTGPGSQMDPSAGNRGRDLDLVQPKNEASLHAYSGSRSLTSAQAPPEPPKDSPALAAVDDWATLRRVTDAKPSDSLPSAGFSDWRESSEWWQRTCEYWYERSAKADAALARLHSRNQQLEGVREAAEELLDYAAEHGKLVGPLHIALDDALAAFEEQALGATGGRGCGGDA